PRSRLLRVYGPLVAAAALFVLMASLVPTVDRKVVTRTVASGTAPDLGAQGGGDAAGPAAGGAASAAAAGTGATGRRTTVPPGAHGPCADRQQQVPGDAYSPPCIAFS